MLRPREPKAHSTEEEEHVYTYVSYSTKTVKGILSGQSHMEENDKQHGSSHQFASIAADVLKFNVLDGFHECLLILGLGIYFSSL